MASLESKEPPSDLEFEDDDGRIPLVPRLIAISKKDIFALAAKELALTIQSEATTQIDNHMFVTRLTIGNMLARVSYSIETKEFIGSAASSTNLSIQNAYHDVLEYLENENRIEIDDYNAKNVARLKKDMVYSNTWSMLFENETKKLKQEMSIKNMALQHFFHSFDSVCQETSSMLSLLASKQKPAARKRPHQLNVFNSNKKDPSSIYCSFSNAFNNLRAELLRLAEFKDHAK